MFHATSTLPPTKSAAHPIIDTGQIRRGSTHIARAGRHLYCRIIFFLQGVIWIIFRLRPALGPPTNDCDAISR
jgi:hypothetical protein